MTDPTTTSPSPDETRREVLEQPDGIGAESADDWRMPSPAAAAERVVAFVKWFGDGVIDCGTDSEPTPLYARDLCALTCAVQHGYRADEPSRCLHTPLTALPAPVASEEALETERTTAWDEWEHFNWSDFIDMSWARGAFDAGFDTACKALGIEVADEGRAGV